MIGVTCQKHKDRVSEKLIILQNESKIPKGKISGVRIPAVPRSEKYSGRIFGINF